MTHALDPVAVSLARAQQGMLTTAQARAAGLSPFALARLVQQDILKHPGRGLYAVASLVDTAPEAWHRHLMSGARLMYPDAVFTGVSAVLAHEVRVWDADLARPQLLRPVRRGTTMACFHLRPERAGATIATELGETVLLADALVQLAADDGIASGVASMDHALHEGKVTRDELEAALDAVALWPGSSRAKSAVLHSDGRRESVAESRCALVMALKGIDVIPQFEVRDPKGDFVARVDFLIEGTNIVIEVDGKVKYASGDPEVLWAEKKREDDIRRAGCVVVRVTWADLERLDRLVAKVSQALRAA
ncbi:MAG: type IV toxin-antitoxin system AbiEi family antitoxin domain-containing protein [Phycicoccus sp.]|nr:type IV toxin-antitoxin system AbiEi family antitoxin domain-containing protein [Phycicoccus sp.]